jgi:surface polysaccharide O-acyltransferase-like enzyme
VKRRLLWPDILKILAIFGVILLHVAAPFVVPFENSRDWWIGNIFDSLSRWCVPLFVMVSGALILPNAENVPLRQFLLVRVGRILVPFLAWSTIYFLYRLQVKGHALTLLDFFRMLLTEPIYYHLWFIYMLIVLYLFAPALSAFLNEAARKHAWYLIALWFFWASLLPIIEEPLAFETYFTPGMNDYSALRLSGYFLLGYMLKEWRARSGLQLSMILLLFLVSGAVTIFGTYQMSLGRGEFSPFFYKYFSVTVVAMSISLFLLVKSIWHRRKERSEDGPEGNPVGSPGLLQRVGMSVFGIYLVHALVLELLRDGRFGFTIDHTSFFGMGISLAAGLPIFAVSIFVISLATVLAVRLIPILRDMLT